MSDIVVYVGVQDFLINLGIKPRMHLWEISILSLNSVIVRPGSRQTYQNYEQSQQKFGTFLENKVCTLKLKVFKKFHL